MNELPNRKIIRLKNHDYSSAGYYFITICTKDKQNPLGKIVGDAHQGVPYMELNEMGNIVHQHIESINSAYDNVKVDKFVVMPNHIHLILIVEGGTPECASPTKSVVAKVVNAFKSLTSRRVGGSMWQRAYHDRIIRNEKEYMKIWNYIDGNPAIWADDCYYINSI